MDRVEIVCQRQRVDGSAIEANVSAEVRWTSSLRWNWPQSISTRRSLQLTNWQAPMTCLAARSPLYVIMRFLLL
jgi:hypothetical protein